LIELLVVIAIILTLAGVSMAVFGGVMEKSKKSTAKSDCTGLVQGINNYTMDTGRLPLIYSPKELARKSRKDDQIYVTTAVDDDSRIMAVLTNYLPRGDEKLNPKKTSYFDTTQTDVAGSPGLYFENKGSVGLMDPWENPYHVILNANPDDRTPRVQVGDRMVTKNVAVYSVGKDKEGSIEDGKIHNEEYTEDNVTSW
jgi:type II secretory pathway pseudopilin PulG